MLAKTPFQAKQHSLITVTLHSFFKLSSSALISFLEVKLFMDNTDFGMLLWTRVKFHYQQLDCQHKFFLDWSLPIIDVSSWEELIINCKNLLCDDFLNSHDLNLCLLTFIWEKEMNWSKHSMAIREQRLTIFSKFWANVTASSII